MYFLWLMLIIKHQAQLYEKHRSEWKFLCAAAILDKSIVLTHAHCLEDQNIVKYYGVRAGKTKYIKSSERIPDLISVERIEKHAGYDESTIDYDVALIKVLSPSKYISCYSIANSA